MSDIDEMTITAELRDRVTGLAVSAPPPLAAITARARARRQHRRFAATGLGVAGMTAATALALELTGPAGPAPAPATLRAAGATAPTAAPAMIRTAAFTIVDNRDGTVTLTIDPVELFDAGALERDLAQYGIPALVTTDRICTSDPAPAEISQVESFDPGAAGKDATITIDPKAIPAGSKLSFGTAGLRGDVRGAYSSLIDPDAYTCTSTPPTDAEPHPGRAVWFIRGGG